MRVHNDERNYACTYCPKRFREACAQRKHEGRHINGKILKQKKSKKEKSTKRKRTIPEYKKKELCLMNMVTKDITK